MGFLAPALLWGLSLAALPVVIHLFSRRRYRHVPWAAMSFLSAAWTARSQSVRLENVLLLALRTAALALFALALARPVIHGARAPSADAIVLVDRSASMHYRDGSGTLFEAAAARASDVILSLGPDSRVALATFDSRVRFLTPPAGAAPRAAVALLAPLAPGYVQRNLRFDT